MRKMMCVVCGKDADLDSYCNEHYPKLKMRMKSKIFINVCKVCADKYVGERKIRLEKEIMDQAKIDVDVDIHRDKAIIIPKDPRYSKHTLWIIYKKITCENCERRSGGYYEAIVQLRPKIPALLNKIGVNPEIVKVEEKPEGYDIFTMTTTGAKRVIEALRKYTTEKNTSVKLAGLKKGIMLNRTVILLRLKEPSPEDEEPSEYEV